jgi:hypothetical protein
VHVHRPARGFPLRHRSLQVTLPGYLLGPHSRAPTKGFDGRRTAAWLSLQAPQVAHVSWHCRPSASRRCNAPRRVSRSRSSVSCVLSLSAKSRDYWVVSPSVGNGWKQSFPDCNVSRTLHQQGELSGARTHKLPLTAPVSHPTFAGTKALWRPRRYHFRRRLLANLPASPYGHCRWFDYLRDRFCEFVLPPEPDRGPAALLPALRVPSPAQVIRTQVSPTPCGGFKSAKRRL